jgi:hypothetical protein
VEQNLENLDIFQRTKNKRVGRTPYIDYEAAPWGILLQNSDIGDPLTQVGKRFRRRFRIPNPLFRQIVEECESINLFEIEVNQIPQKRLSALLTWVNPELDCINR